MLATRLSSAIAILTVAACRFSPDLSAYPRCVEGACPVGYVCIAEESICVGIPDAGEASDAGASDGQPFDAGPVPDAGPLRFTTVDLPPGKVGELYVEILAVAGGASPYTFSLASGGLPTGLSLTPQGTLAGTPSSAGASSFAVQATDATSQVAAKGFVLAVAPVTGETLTIETATLPEGLVATAYSVDLAAAGGVAPYQWNVASGALPSGLTLSTSGSIRGVPVGSGETTLELSVFDSSPAPQRALRSFALRINPAQGVVLAIQTTAVPDGTVAAYYLAALVAGGGTTPYTWSLASGSALPAGLTLSTTGAVAGTPTSAGSVSFTAQVVDSSSPAQTSSRALSLSISGGTVAPLTISTASLPEGTVQVAYSAALVTSGGTAPVGFSLSSGSTLPGGLSLSDAGAISGLPTSAGVFGLGVTAQDASSPPQTATRSYVLTIGTGTSTVPLSVSTSVLPSGTVGQAYSQALAATGGTIPYAWSLAAGALAPGLALAPSGAITGTATVSGAFSFSIKVTDAGAPAQEATRGLTLAVQPSILRIETISLPDATVGASYRAQVTAAGGVQPYLFSLASGTLPKGLSLCGSGSCVGEITGTPVARGRNGFEVQVTDASSPTQTAQKRLTIDVN